MNCSPGLPYKCANTPYNVLLTELDYIYCPLTLYCTNIPVFGDPQKLVVSSNLVEIGSLFIGKEQIGFPNGVQHGWVKVKRVIGILAVGQPRVIPLLSQEDVHSVILLSAQRQPCQQIRAEEATPAHFITSLVCLILVQVNVLSSQYIFCLRSLLSMQADW